MVKRDGVSTFRFRDFIKRLSAGDVPNEHHVIATSRYNLPVVHSKCTDGLSMPAKCESFASFASILRDEESEREKKKKKAKKKKPKTRAAGATIDAATGMRESATEQGRFERW